MVSLWFDDSPSPLDEELERKIDSFIKEWMKINSGEIHLLYAGCSYFPGSKIERMVYDLFKKIVIDWMFNHWD